MLANADRNVRVNALCEQDLNTRAFQLKIGGGGRSLCSEVQVKQVWTCQEALYIGDGWGQGLYRGGLGPCTGTPLWAGRMTDKNDWKHYLPTISLARGNEGFLPNWCFSSLKQMADAYLQSAFPCRMVWLQSSSFRSSPVHRMSRTKLSL